MADDTAEKVKTAIDAIHQQVHNLGQYVQGGHKLDQATKDRLADLAGQLQDYAEDDDDGGLNPADAGTLE